jgi:hypothetical protein
MDRDSVRHDTVKQDLLAAVETRRELGDAYESELVDSFLDRVEERLDARVEQRVRRELAERDTAGVRERRDGRPGRGDTWFAAFSLIIAIPLTAIVAVNFHDELAALTVLWLGIVAVNAARVTTTRRSAPPHRERD